MAEKLFFDLPLRGEIYGNFNNGSKVEIRDRYNKPVLSINVIDGNYLYLTRQFPGLVKLVLALLSENEERIKKLIPELSENKPTPIVKIETSLISGLPDMRGYSLKEGLKKRGRGRPRKA